MSDLIFSFVFLIILIIVSTCIDEGIPLILLGFITLAVAFNLGTIFSLTSTTLSGLGVDWFTIIRLIYMMTAIFFLAKSIGTAGSIFKQRQKNGN